MAAVCADALSRRCSPWRTTRSARCACDRRIRLKTRTLIVLLDFDLAVDRLYAFGLTRDGRSLVCRFLGSGAAGEPHDAVLVRVDMNAPQAGDVRRRQLGLDFRRYRRVLHECRRV